MSCLDQDHVSCVGVKNLVLFCYPPTWEEVCVSCPLGVLMGPWEGPLGYIRNAGSALSQSLWAAVIRGSRLLSKDQVIRFPSNSPNDHASVASVWMYVWQPSCSQCLGEQNAEQEAECFFIKAHSIQLFWPLSGPLRTIVIIHIIPQPFNIIGKDKRKEKKSKTKKKPDRCHCSQ